MMRQLGTWLLKKTLDFIIDVIFNYVLHIL
jgi:hypothetical protein